MQSVYEFIKACGTYFIASAEGEQPRVRPFGTINIFEGKLYVQTGRKKPCYKQFKDRKVELCCFNGKEWLRLAGTLVEDPRVEAEQAMLDAYPSLQGMYTAGDGNTAVLYFKDAVATFSSFTAGPREVRF